MKARNIISDRAAFSGIRYGSLTARDFFFSAVCCGCFRKNGVLIPRVRFDAEVVLRVCQNLLAGIQERAGGYRRAADLVHIAAKRIRIRRNANKLLRKGGVSDAASQSRSLLQRAYINLRDIAARRDTHCDRDLSAVTLRRSRQSIPLYVPVSILRGKDLVQFASLGNLFEHDLLILAVRKHRLKRRALCGQFLLCDRAFCHFIGYRQGRGGHQGKHEQAKAQFQDLIHAPAPPQSSSAW